MPSESKKILVTGSAALMIRSLAMVTLMRASVNLLYNSFFRAGFELLYTPIAPTDKRTGKVLIDVGADRSGDLLGGVLVMAILPAEYGIDPTGIGEKLGLTRLYTAAEPATQTATTADPEQGPLHNVAGELRNNSLSLPLGPRQGAEIKAVMQKGQRLVFHWKAEGGQVHFDMHGEPPDAGGSFTSFWIGDQQAEASGAFTAPFDGTHGWYWENRGDEAVVIQLTTSGFYDSLFMP